mgnify:CR=1 FL=1
MNQRILDVGEAIVRQEQCEALYMGLMAELAAEEARLRDVLSITAMVGRKTGARRSSLPKLKSQAELLDLMERIDAALANKESAVQALRALGVSVV